MLTGRANRAERRAGGTARGQARRTFPALARDEALAGANKVPALAQLHVNRVPLAVLRRRRDVAEEILSAQLVGDAGRRGIEIASATR